MAPKQSGMKKNKTLSKTAPKKIVANKKLDHILVKEKLLQDKIEVIATQEKTKYLSAIYEELKAKFKSTPLEEVEVVVEFPEGENFRNY